jgi:protein-tyrosine kinase
VHKRLYASNRIPQIIQFDSGCPQVDGVQPIQNVVYPRSLVALTDQGSVGAERFRALAIRLRNFQKRQRLKKLLVTSSVKGEGKSVVSANLAVTLAQGQRTLLIDCDLHQSGLRDVLGIHGQPGLSDWWGQPSPIVKFLRRMDEPPLWYLSAGEVRVPPLDILQSRRFTDMLNQVSRWFDWIVLDSPPLVPVADSGLLAAHVDGSLLIVRQSNTPKPLLKEALKTENLKLLGIVANEWESSGQRYYTQYYKGYIPHRQVISTERQSLPPCTGTEQ